MMSYKLNSNFVYKNQEGIGLVEVLVGVAILAFIGLAISSYVVNQRQFIVKLEGSAGCRNDTESLLKDFSNSSNARVANALVGSPTDNAPNRSLASVGSHQTPYASTVVNTFGGINQYANFQNIENSVTRAYVNLRNYPTLCSEPNGVVIDEDTINTYRNLFTNTSILDRLILTEKKVVTLKIIPIRMSSGAEDCDLVVSPLSLINTTEDNGYKIKVSITKPQTADSTCRGESIIKYNSDSSAPSITPVGGGITGNGMTCTFTGQVQSSEPGSAFECSLDGGANWSICGAQLTADSLSANTNTKVNITHTGVTGGANQTLRIRSIDTASNRSTASVTSNNSITCTPPVSCPVGSTAISNSSPLPADIITAHNGRCYVGGCGGTNTDTFSIRYPTNINGGSFVPGATNLSCCPTGTTPTTTGTFANFCTTSCGGATGDTITEFYPYGHASGLGGQATGRTNTTDCTTSCTMICANYVNCFYRANCTGGPEGNGAWMGSCGLGATFSLGCGATATSAICSDGNPNHECAYLDVAEGNNPTAAFPTDSRPACTCTCNADPSTAYCGSNATGVDTCGNSCVLPGTASGGGCAAAGTVACGQVVTDTCGNSCGYTGTMGCCDNSTCTAVTDPSNVCSGTPVAGTTGCGNSCNTGILGTKSCGGGGGGGPLEETIIN